MTLRVVVRFKHDLDEPVIGFLLSNSHGIRAYGTNTREQQIDFGTVRSGEVIEATFSFDCWLGVDQYTISLAVHSRDGLAYDWLDAALFVRVTSMTLTEGIANLHAGASVRRRSAGAENSEPEQVVLDRGHGREVSYG